MHLHVSAQQQLTIIKFYFMIAGSELHVRKMATLITVLAAVVLYYCPSQQYHNIT